MKEVIKDMSYIMRRIPNFIDTKSFRDHAVWNVIYDMNNILLDLIQSKVLSDRVIFKKYLLFNDKYNDIIDVPYLDRIDKYFNEIIKYMEQLCVNEELYEAAQNIKKFKEI